MRTITGSHDLKTTALDLGVHAWSEDERGVDEMRGLLESWRRGSDFPLSSYTGKDDHPGFNP